MSYGHDDFRAKVNDMVRDTLIVAFTLIAANPAASQQRPSVPLSPGLVLTWVTSVSGERDYENRVEVTGSDHDAITLQNVWNRGSRPGAVQWRKAERPVLHRVRLTTHSFYTSIYDNDHRDYSGWTIQMTSVAVLEELKTRGRSDIAFSLPELSRIPYEGTLTRVAYDEFPVLLNGKRVNLHGVRARGRLESPRAPTPWVQLDFVFLDDSVAPWFLEFQMHRPDGVGGKRQLVRVSYRPSVESDLATNCRATVYDIYFATASADLDPGSAPTLAAIAKAIADHRDWHLDIVGHTDSIGSESSNLELSRRRAEATRQALMASFGVDGAHVRSDGRGESQPLEDNGTPAGRARNRRVELVRECRGKPRS